MDRGFSQDGRANPRAGGGGATYSFANFFSKNYMKLKEFGQPNFSWNFWQGTTVSCDLPPLNLWKHWREIWLGNVTIAGIINKDSYKNTVNYNKELS